METFTAPVYNAWFRLQYLQDR